jgi:hypothetical protein
MITSKTQPAVHATALAPATVGFRLDEKSRRLLGKRSARLGVSPHELAKDYVLERLNEQEERELLRMALNDLFVVNQQLRGDIATTAEAILIAAGKVDEKEAREWVERTFRPLPGSSGGY